MSRLMMRFEFNNYDDQVEFTLASLMLQEISYVNSYSCS